MAVAHAALRLPLGRSCGSTGSSGTGHNWLTAGATLSVLTDRKLPSHFRETVGSSRWFQRVWPFGSHSCDLP